jgi:hypothetical protein
MRMRRGIPLEVLSDLCLCLCLSIILAFLLPQLGSDRLGLLPCFCYGGYGRGDSFGGLCSRFYFGFRAGSVCRRVWIAEFAPCLSPFERACTFIRSARIDLAVSKVHDPLTCFPALLLFALDCRICTSSTKRCDTVRKVTHGQKQDGKTHVSARQVQPRAVPVGPADVRMTRWTTWHDSGDRLAWRANLRGRVACA